MSISDMKKVDGLRFEAHLTNVARLSAALALAMRGVRAVAAGESLDEVDVDGLVELAEVVTAEAETVRAMWLGDEPRRSSLFGESLGEAPSLSGRTLLDRASAAAAAV